MKTSSAKAKGRRGAQEVRTMMMALAPFLEEDDIIVTPSGVTGEDLRLSPAARSVFPISTECKNQEKLNIWDSIAQCEGNAGTYIPVLFFRRNRTKMRAVVDADVLLNLLAHYQGPKNELHGKAEITSQQIQNPESVS